MVHDVFISYSREDRAIADAACAILEQNRVRVWIAPRDIQAGGNWSDSLGQAIDCARVLVLVFSNATDNSPQIEREVARAIARGLPIIPYFLENIRPREALGSLIHTFHPIDGFSRPPSQSLQDLAAAVKTAMELRTPIQIPARPAVRPPVAEDLGSRMHPLSNAEMLAFVRESRASALSPARREVETHIRAEEMRRRDEETRRRRDEEMYAPVAAPSAQSASSYSEPSANCALPLSPEPSPLPDSAARSKVGVLIGFAAALAIGAYLFRHEIGLVLGGVAKLLFHGSTPPMPAVASKGDLADVSVYAPPSVARGDTFLVQVFVHSETDTEGAIDRIATAADFAATRRAVSTLDLELETGDRLDIAVEGIGFEIEDASQTIVWRNRPMSCGFLVRVPPEFSSPAGHIRVRVFHQAIPIGRISFSIRVVAQAAAGGLEPIGDLARKYRRAFLSYASADRTEVLKRAQVLRAGRIDFFQDLLSLEPGDKWEKRLYDEIERCDLFLLFWSRAARDSAWVQKEIDHALGCLRNGGSDRPEILPIILEGPPPPPPPATLAAYHFNDPLCYMIAAAQESSR